jgi:hypothetical protein
LEERVIAKVEISLQPLPICRCCLALRLRSRRGHRLLRRIQLCLCWLKHWLLLLLHWPLQCRLKDWLLLLLLQDGHWLPLLLLLQVWMHVRLRLGPHKMPKSGRQGHAKWRRGRLHCRPRCLLLWRRLLLLMLLRRLLLLPTALAATAANRGLALLPRCLLGLARLFCRRRLQQAQQAPWLARICHRPWRLLHAGGIGKLPPWRRRCCLVWCAAATGCCCP